MNGTTTKEETAAMIEVIEQAGDDTIFSVKDLANAAGVSTMKARFFAIKETHRGGHLAIVDDKFNLKLVRTWGRS